METEIYRIFQTNNDISSVLKGLFDLARKEQPSLTLTKLCQASGLASKGYMSEVLRGMRLPKPYVADSVAQALGLQGLALKYVVTLAKRDCTEAGLKRIQLEVELASIRKGLEVSIIPHPESQGFSGFTMEVFCAFGLYGGHPTRAMLVDYFGRDRAFEVDDSLRELNKAGFIAEEEGGFKLLESSTHYAFSEGADGFQHLEFLRQAIYASVQAASTWFSRKADSHFESMILSVRSSEYRVALQKLKADLLAWEAGLETQEADSLIRVNVQIHPLGAPKSKN